MSVPRVVAATGVLMMMVTSASLHAQHVSLDLRNGGVTLVANGVSLQQILAEWSRVGGVEITMRGEELPKAPVTLLLRDVTERQALDILLREVGGYVLAANENAPADRSMFRRIVLVQAQGRLTGDQPLGLAALASTRPDGNEPGRDVLDVEVAEDGVQVATEGPMPRDGAARRAPGTPREAADATDVPPTPLLRPTPQSPPPGNPFGTAAGSARPGTVAPGPPSPPPGVVYPPVTNPNAGLSVFTPGEATR